MPSSHNPSRKAYGIR